MRTCNAILLGGLMAALTGAPQSAYSNPESNRVESVRAGWALIDAGNPEAARSRFLDRLQIAPSDLAAADGLVAADLSVCLWNRCRDDLTSLIEPATGAELPALRAFLEGLKLGQRRSYAAASDEFVRAAEMALAAKDTLSAAVAHRRAGLYQMRLGDVEGAGRQARASARVPTDGACRRLRMESDLLLAGSFNLAAQLSRADSIYAEIIVQAEADGFKSVLCDALNGRGTIRSKQRQPSASLPYFARAEALAREMGDTPRLTKVLKNKGYDHTQAREVDEALECYEEARVLAGECDLQEYLGHIHTGFGAAAEVHGDREQAIEHFRDSYLAHASLGDRRGELGARQRLAYNLMITGRYSEAATHYERCLEIIEERESPYLLNWVLGGLALTNHKLGHLDLAEHFYLRAREANEALGDQMSVAWCHLYLGWLEMLRGDYRQALVQSHEAREIYRGLGDPEGVGDAHVVMAEVHFRLGNWDQARQDYETAAQLGQDNGLGELLNRAYQGLAEVCAAAERPNEARRYCEQALELAREWSDNDGVIWALIQLAEQSVVEGDVETARRHLAAASTRQNPDGHYDFRARTRLLQARCADRPAEAISLAHEALALAREGGLPEREWEAQSDLGAYHLAAGDTDSARRSQMQAIHVVESLRRAVGTDELRRNMLRPALAPYERMIGLCLGTGTANSTRSLEALAISERSRAQILATRLQSAGAAGPSGGTGHAGNEELEHLAGIAFLQSRLQQAGLGAEERKRLRGEVVRLEDEIRYLRLGSESTEPIRSENEAQTRETAELLGVLGPDEQALSYFLGVEESILFHVAAGKVRAERLPGRRFIEERVRRYLALRSGPEVPPEILANAERGLFDLLVGPVADQLSAQSTLVVVPDGVLHRLSFAALRGSEGRIIQQHQVFTAPSLRTLASLRQREEERRRGPKHQYSVLTVGCGAVNPSQESGSRRVHPFDASPVVDLAGAREEAQQVAGLFDRAMVLTGSAADEASIKRAPLDQAEVLHIAAHSYADEREARRSYVLLNPSSSAPDSNGPPEDGLLQWGEAAALNLRASLVTLASCRSADGVLSVGEGVTGLTQAFLFAGGTCVLASQSDIGDEYSRRFMLAFYDNLRHGRSAAEALREVQLRFAEASPLNGGPDPWANFVLVGDGAVRLSSAPTHGASPLEKGLLISAISLCLIFPAFSIVRIRRRN